MNMQPLAVPAAMAPALVVMSLCLCGFAPPPDDFQPAESGEHAQAGDDAGHPVIITSDSRAFCDRLITIIDAYGPPPREVRDLRFQGAHLCAEGKVRSGIVQLRRALVALKEDTHS
ncbi:hypothetical protein HLH34_16250 [Gluconacetobacter azotocaptans]|uniref:Uncharacterized protein n=1 Tax=Gluconacetobacter azotocaptans TaxID=142834 RepID=A0A7W4PF61_9PROT|nr:hypothetical protein [Gluconacetobacter azotocaptans]MBB2191488.1 hypothetical protein [Gluconacetobacter azotocaptans]MBM9403785.1 hypothetical protein [Gluconacetobacter azotocaptans]